MHTLAISSHDVALAVQWVFTNCNTNGQVEGIPLFPFPVQSHCRVAWKLTTSSQGTKLLTETVI